MIWFMKRKRWRIGPKLPFAYDRLCSTSLSRTLVLIVSIDYGNHSYQPGLEMIGRVVLFDFHTKNWNDVPTISVPPYYWMDCKMTVNFDKTEILHMLKVTPVTLLKVKGHVILPR